jgi:nitroimidazol reductase NimA-like FMN-containing flavoprotein (pyridoxamine 5'-phosphate oxidase superfamily)
VTNPARDRPVIPAGYGIKSDAAGMLEWEKVRDLVSSAETYWVATTGPDGAPHLTPIHASFAADRIYLGGDPATRWWRNLAENPAVQVGIEDGETHVLFRGRAVFTKPSPERFAELAANVDSKYGWSMDESWELWEITPTTVIAYDLTDFASSPTRFRFWEE